MDKVTVSKSIKIDPSITSDWRQYFDATFVITACIIMLVMVMIYVAYRYRSIRVGARVRTFIFHDMSDVSYKMEECSICLDDFVDGDLLASLQPCNHVYHQECIALHFARAPTCPMCRCVISIGDN